MDLYKVLPLRDGIGYVSLVSHMGNDLSVVNAARVSYGKRSEQFTDKDRRLVRYLITHSHGTPFEHVTFQFRVRAPLFIVHQWERHRMASYNEECLAGDTMITRMSKNHGGVYQKNSTLETLWRNWHEGVPDSMGRTRLLKSCRSIYVRSFDEQTLAPVKSRVVDIKKQGVQRTYLVTTESGRQVRATMSHKFFTPAGWFRLEELVPEFAHVYRSGKVREPGSEAYVPPRTRQGIQVWTTQQKPLVVPAEGTSCYLCGKTFSYAELELDHEVPVVKDLARALDITNLKPACKPCHRDKSNSEQVLARRSIVGGLRADKIISVTEPRDEETYDLVLEGPHRNFLANGLVVHNSGRYIELRPDFYTPSETRPDMGLHPASAVSVMRDHWNRSFNLYQMLRERGMSNELARTVLPASLYKEFWWTVNARSLMNFLELRTDEHAQWEIRKYADAVEEIFGSVCPAMHQAFKDNGRIAP